MRGTAAAAAGVFTVMRTTSDPARASSAICFAVLAAFSVSVLVIDCTTTGAPPPTITLPTRTPTLDRRMAGPAGRGCREAVSLIGRKSGSRRAGCGNAQEYHRLLFPLPSGERLGERGCPQERLFACRFFSGPP